MSDLVEPPTRAVVDPADRTLALGATGMLRTFNQAGVLDAADVHVAHRLGALTREPGRVAGSGEPSKGASQAGNLAEVEDAVLLALALVVRAARLGSVCVDLTEVGADLAAVLESSECPELPWPQPDTWPALVAAHRLASPTEGAGSPAVLHIEGSLLYLDRYWREEVQVERDLRRRIERPVAPVHDPEALARSLDRLFPGAGDAEQRAAAQVAVRQSTTVLTGGPGTGKTTTVAGILALLAEQYELAGNARPRIALAAPTAKAAARLEEAVGERLSTTPLAGASTDLNDVGGNPTPQFTEEDRARLGPLRASTLHRLLGWKPGSAVRFRHDRDNRLPHDIVVVDETSMLSLTMMARLIAALRPTSRLVLVGDPDQLSSVDAGAVLGDLVTGLGAGDPVRSTTVAALSTTHRFGGGIAQLASAVRAGEKEATLAVLAGDARDVEFLDSGDAVVSLREVLLPDALELRSAALSGRAESALDIVDRHRLLCAHREGPWGVAHWNRVVEGWLAEETGDHHWNQWYAGRPVLVTANDYGLKVFNGDAGVAYRRADGVLRVAIRTPNGTIDVPPGRLSSVETMHAMTIHKAQGSQAPSITVLLPGEESRLLTRELFYTAITRAQHHVRVVGSAEAVGQALVRRVRRASGLAARLEARPAASADRASH